MKTLKYISYALGCILALTGALALLCVAVNYGDESLHPDIQTLLQDQYVPSEKGQRAMYYVLGLQTGDHQDPESAGRKLWEERLRDSDRRTIRDVLIQKDWWPSPQVVFPKNSTVESFTKDPRLSQELKKGPGIIKEYIELLQYGELARYKSKDPYPLPWQPTVKLLNGHRWMSLHYMSLIEKNNWNEVERLIQLENRFFQSQLKHNTLLAVMIARIVANNNAAILTENRKRHPQPYKTATVDSFNFPDSRTLMREAMNEELRFFHPMLIGLKTEPWNDVMADWNSAKEFHFKVLWKAGPFAFQPHQTLNKFYEFTQEVQTKRCGDSVSPDCFDIRKWTDLKRPGNWLVNPFGRFMLGQVAPSFTGRMRKLEEMDKKLAEMRAGFRT